MAQRRLSKKQRTACLQILEMAARKDARLTPDELTAALPLIVRMIDEDVIKVLPDSDESIPLSDRLFDLFMIRFECLQEHRSGILAISDLIRRSPALAHQMYKLQLGSLRHLLVMVAIPHLSTLRLHILLGVYHLTFSRWGQDATPDLSKTMVYLNAALQRTTIPTFGY